MKKATRFTACALSAALVCQSALPAFAAEVTKHETVYVNLGADGTISKQTVSNWVHADKGLGNIQDRAQLADIVNLKTSEVPVDKNGFLQWSIQDRDVYYQGISQGQLPVTVEITYILDGKKVTAEEAAGKSGHLVMKLALTNHETRTATVDGKARKIATPFVTVVGCALPVDNFENVVADHGIVQTDSSKQIVGFVTLPGVRESLSGLMTGRLDSLNDYLLDTVTIEADVKDLEVPSFMIASSCDTDLLKEKNSNGDFDNVFASLDDLETATNELIDGGKKLADGASELSTGANKLASGTGDLSGGAATLSGGLATLNGKSGELTAGAQAIADGILSNANSQLSAQLKAAGYAGEIPALTYDNYGAVLDSILGAVGTQAKESARNQLRAAINASGSLDEASVTTVLYTANKMVAEGDKSDLPTLLTGAGAKATNAGQVAAMQAAIAAAGGFYAVPEVQSILTTMAIGAIMQQQGCDAAAAQQAFAALPADQQAGALAAAFEATKAMMDPTGSYDEGTLQLVFAIGAKAYRAANPTGLDQAAFGSNLADAKNKALDAQFVSAALAAGTDEQIVAYAVSSSGQLEGANQAMASLRSSLDGVRAFISGLGQYTAAVAEASAGASKLASGAAEAKKGADALASGSKELANGAVTLRDGLIKYNNEGISKLTSSQELKNAGTAVKVLDEMQQSAESYHSYAGAPDGADVTTQFVMKTTAPKAKEKDNGTADKAAKKTSFVERIKNLFV